MITNSSFSILFVIFIFFGCKNHPNSISLSASTQQDVLKQGWEKEYWSNQDDYSDTLSTRFDSRVLVLQSDTLTRDRWYKKINIKPYAHYKVSGFIKTKNIEGENPGAGAGFRLGKLDFIGDTVFKGTQDWTPVKMKFDSGGEDSFMLECLLGKRGRAKGQVYFDKLQLEEISAKELNPSVILNFNKKKEPMSPYLYGQFIEHMGRSIYGGLWAEMLTDRKFYYKPGSHKSAWKFEGDTLYVSIDSSKTYSRGNIPVLQTLNGSISLSQDSLAVKAGEVYNGRLVFKASAGMQKVEISLSDNEKNETQSFKVKPGKFETLPFSFSSDFESTNAELKVTFSGQGKVTMAAVSLMPANNIAGFRPDVLELMKQLNAPVYRWPGGNFVSGYDWKDGIGDPDKRPTKYEHAWNGLEYNDVGVDEFMQLCDLLKTDAYIAVNTGLGTAEMAAEEVEYVNGSQNTKLGKWRAANGHAQPYDVQLWAVGNEMFGDWQLGHMPIADYVLKHNAVAQAMWKVDPDIKLVAVGSPGKWNDMMYSHSSKYMDYISEHFYRQDWHAGGLLTHVKQIPEAIREIAEEHRRCRNEIPEIKGENIKIVLDEWNYWYGPHIYGLLGTRYYLRDALGIAAGINEFSRQSDMFYMANYAQTINVIGAIKTTKTDSWLESTGLVLKLYREKFGSQPIAVSGSPEPLDVAATLTQDGKYLTLSVINATHQNYDLNLKGIADKLVENGASYIISGTDDMAYNDEQHKNRISIKENANSLSIAAVSAGIY